MRAEDGMLDRLSNMLKLAGTESGLFPSTDLYSEGWLLRLTLDWFSEQADDTHALSFAKGARWFSEGRLSTQFSDRGLGPTSLAEGRTHADGIIGHFTVGIDGIADISLAPGARQLLITEAKMFSPLAQGVTNARYFDQAARNVACLAETLHLTGIKPDRFDSLRFFVLAPEEQIVAGVFAAEMDKESIQTKVQRRVKEYGDPAKRLWLEEWFSPVLETARVDCLSWEELIEHIWLVDAQFGQEIKKFYCSCVRFNRQFRGGS